MIDNLNASFVNHPVSKSTCSPFPSHSHNYKVQIYNLPPLSLSTPCGPPNQTRPRPTKRKRKTKRKKGDQDHYSKRFKKSFTITPRTKPKEEFIRKSRKENPRVDPDSCSKSRRKENEVKNPPSRSLRPIQ
jgi:hypothetical protein